MINIQYLGILYMTVKKSAINYIKEENDARQIFKIYKCRYTK